MADLRMEREFPVSPEHLFAWVSDGPKLLQWWGPEGLSVPEHDLDFTRTAGACLGELVVGEGDQVRCALHRRAGDERAQLEEGGVATVAGTSFGAFGEGYIRFSYANSVENIQAALDRIGELLSSKAA